MPSWVANHTPGFTACTGTGESYDRAVITGKRMAVTGWKVLTDSDLARRIRGDFEED
jgi:hypothetical protein